MGRKTFKKQITNEELSSQINSKNRQLIKLFLKEKSTRSSETTIKGYASDLEIFFTWVLLNCENKHFVEIKKIEFSEFFSFCVDELKYNSARFGRMRSVLSSLSNFIEKFLDSDFPTFKNVILKTIESVPKEPVREKTILSEEQVNSLLKYLSEEISKPQEACLLALAAYSGARISELLRFSTDLIDPNNTAFDGLFLESKKQIRTKGRGKTGKMLYKYILKDSFMPYYEKWLIERSKILEKTGQSHNCLFIKPDGTPAEVATVRSWIQKWENYLQVPFYPHACRHFLVTQLTRIGLSSDLIVELVGWSGTEMYKLYNDLSAKDRSWQELDKLKEHLEKK